MTEICPYDQCTGCGVCAGVCPKKCITISGDAFGYIRPVIDQKICIDCGLCVRNCPNNINLDLIMPQKAYAAWSIDVKDRETSTSGGIASVLSHQLIQSEGVVYGAVGYGCGIVEHQRVTSLNELYKFKRSKYVQSHIDREIYYSIKQDLKNNKTVLFIGTPCQTAAVRTMAGNNNNLICVDIICHGVPSQQILRDHILSLPRIDCKNITSFSTRDNKEYSLTLLSGSEIVYKKPFPEDQYLNGFSYGLFHRPSCYQCHYARPQRQSDLTIGDFWGLGQTDYPHKKVSVVLVNTQRGAEILDAAKDRLFLDERTVEEAVRDNTQLNHPSLKHESYELFRRLYLSRGYSVAIKRSLRKFYIKNAIYNFCVKIPGFNKFYKKTRR